MIDKNLTALYASGNSGITDAGVRDLKNLATLNASRNRGISAEMVQRIRRRTGLAWVQKIVVPGIEPFLATIADHEGEACPLLVCADWLEDRGVDATELRQIADAVKARTT